MLLALSSLLPTNSNITHSLHFLNPNSSSEFASPKPLHSPITSDQERRLVPPRSGFDLAIANVDDLQGFMSGVWGILKPGGWVVFTEFGKEEGGKDVAGEHRSILAEAKVRLLEIGDERVGFWANG
jgi:hypothetical protein